VSSHLVVGSERACSTAVGKSVAVMFSLGKTTKITKHIKHSFSKFQYFSIMFSYEHCFHSWETILLSEMNEAETIVRKRRLPAPCFFLLQIQYFNLLRVSTLRTVFIHRFKCNCKKEAIESRTMIFRV
jgi:hypothetical protein